MDKEHTVASQYQTANHCVVVDPYRSIIGRGCVDVVNHSLKKETRALLRAFHEM